MLLRIRLILAIFVIGAALGFTIARAGPGAIGGASAVDTQGRSKKTLRAPDFVDRFNVVYYGAKGDGVTDDTAAIQAAITAASSAGGGTVVFPAGTFRVLGQLNFPHAGLPPVQPSIHLRGAGAGASGMASTGVALSGSTVLDMRYAGLYGKILTLGHGLLEVSGISFTDGASGTTPWLYTTNTTLRVHDCGFFGSKLDTLCDQDAIVLGGTVEAWGDANPTHGFQGYGTTIRSNYFVHTRRAVWARTYANALVIEGNTVWFGSGSNLANGAAFDFQGSSASGTTGGNYVAGNTVEVGGYPYAFSCVHCAINTFVGNGVYDESATTLGVMFYGAGAISNRLISTLHSLPVPIHNLIGSFNYNSVLFDGDALKLGMEIQGAKQNALSLYAGPANDSVYMDFYPDTTSPSARAGLMGFATAGSDNMLLQADTGMLYLNASGANRYVSALKPLQLAETAATPAAGGVTLDASLYQMATYSLATAAGAWTLTLNGGISGNLLTITFKNTSAGAVTWNWPANVGLAGAWVNPGAGKNRSILLRLVGAVWYEVSRTPADVTN